MSLARPGPAALLQGACEIEIYDRLFSCRALRRLKRGGRLGFLLGHPCCGLSRLWAAVTAVSMGLDDNFRRRISWKRGLSCHTLGRRREDLLFGGGRIGSLEIELDRSRFGRGPGLPRLRRGGLQPRDCFDRLGGATGPRGALAMPERASRIGPQGSWPASGLRSFAQKPERRDVSLRSTRVVRSRVAPFAGLHSCRETVGAPSADGRPRSPSYKCLREYPPTSRRARLFRRHIVRCTEHGAGGGQLHSP